MEKFSKDFRVISMLTKCRTGVRPARACI
jgi:hypothetical protein